MFIIDRHTGIGVEVSLGTDGRFRDSEGAVWMIDPYTNWGQKSETYRKIRRPE